MKSKMDGLFEKKIGRSNLISSALFVLDFYGIIYTVKKTVHFHLEMTVHYHNVHFRPDSGHLTCFFQDNRFELIPVVANIIRIRSDEIKNVPKMI